MSLPKISESETTESNIVIIKANTYEDNNQTLMFKFVKKTKEELEDILPVFEKHRSQKSLNIIGNVTKKINLYIFISYIL